MAVFSTIGAWVAGTVLSLGAKTLAYAVVKSVVALGLGIATAKITGVFDPPKQQAAKDPGVKIQLPPATDNKIPVFYGRNHTGGIIVDAQIKNQNNTMVYCMVIGEKTDSGSYTVNQIYRDDQKLNFYTTPTQSHIVQSVTDTNATASNKVAGKMRCRVFAGNAQSSANQIFPTTGTPVAAQTLMTTIDATTNYENLVYAIFEIDYEPEENLLGLGGITYDITNSLSEPSNVLLDYLRNDVYGVGLSNADLDLNSFDDMFDYCDISGPYGNVEYTTTGNISAYHSRWQIDGMLSTYQPVYTNINEICKSASTFFTYDAKSGKFKVTPLRALTTGEKANCFVLDDDNIISDISISSTELYSLYNSIEAEYPSVAKQDQTDVVIINTPAGDRNPNEPDNPVTTRYNLVNDKTRVHNLANIDLRQSRTSTVLEVTGSYETLQIDVGDVVKVNLPLYGYSNKLFRVIKLVETENDASMIGVKISLLEYSDDVYDHSVIQTDAAVNVSGIPGWWTGIWGNANINIPGNIIVTDPANGNANIVNPIDGNIIGNIDFGGIDWGNINFGGPGEVDPTEPIVTIPITTPNIPGVETICIDLGYDNFLSGIKGNTCYEIPAPGGGTFDPGTNTNVSVPVPNLPPQNPTLPGGPLVPDLNLDFSIWGKGDGGNWQTNTTFVPDVPVINPGFINVAKVQDIGVGFQVDEAPASNTNMANAAADPNGTTLGNANSIFTPAIVIPTGGIDFGEYTSLNSIVPFGEIIDPAVINFTVQNIINYEENYASNLQPTGNTISDIIGGEGIAATFDTAIPPSLTDNFTFEMSPSRGQTTANLAYAAANVTPPSGMTYLPTNVTVQPYANNSLANVTVARGMRFKGDIVRSTKGDQYRNLR